MNPSDTIVLVMVVPTLAPMMIGIALSMVIEPDATKATTSAVVVELLWIMAVINKPMKSAVNGFEVAWIIVSAADFPICCREETIRSSANTNSTSVAMMYKTVFKLFLRGWGGGMGVTGSNECAKIA